MENEISIKTAVSAPDFLAAKALILEYAEWLGMDLSFQNFDKEMESLQEMYNPLNGALFMGINNGNPVAVAGVRRFAGKVCEVKRMFVQPASRGLGIGKLLLTECIEKAKSLSYESVKLDTADFMKLAIKLYTDHGFVEIPAYRHNPHEAARYFELVL